MHVPNLFYIVSILRGTHALIPLSFLRPALVDAISLERTDEWLNWLIELRCLSPGAHSSTHAA